MGRELVMAAYDKCWQARAGEAAVEYIEKKQNKKQ
jgi:hypothetical protein